MAVSPACSRVPQAVAAVKTGQRARTALYSSHLRWWRPPCQPNRLARLVQTCQVRQRSTAVAVSHPTRQCEPWAQAMSPPALVPQGAAPGRRRSCKDYGCRSTRPVPGSPALCETRCCTACRRVPRDSCRRHIAGASQSARQRLARRPDPARAPDRSTRNRPAEVPDRKVRSGSDKSPVLSRHASMQEPQIEYQ